MTYADSILKSGGNALSWLKNNGYPVTDQMDLTRSPDTFEGGGQYGVEIPVINNPEVLSRTIRLLKEENVYCTRFNETHGSILLSDGEIGEMLALCREEGYGMLISMGPRPEYDVKGAFYRSEFGLEMGRRVNNLDAIRVSVEESLRLAELGCRGITVYDIGVLRLLTEMRAQNVLPPDMMFKTSTHCMAANPLLAKIFAENGADSVTTAHDLGLPVLHEMRRLNPGLSLDVPTDVYKTKGGFIRFYELAEIVQIAAPVMLKMGASAQGHPYDSLNESVIAERVKRVGRGLEVLDKYLPAKSRITRSCSHYCLPVAPETTTPAKVPETVRDDKQAVA